MAGDWIKMRKSLPTDGRLVRMMSALNADRLRTLGGILSAWCLMDEHTSDGKLDGYTPAAFDDVIGFPGLAHAMAAVGWLEIGDGYLQAPDFERHNGATAKRRAQETVRKMSARNADKCPLNMQTKSAPEKRIEENRREEKDNPPKSPKGDRKKVSDSILEGFALIGRKITTPWSEKEIAALRKLNLPESEIIEHLELFASARKAGWKYHRKDTLTLLNNWQGEIERAEDFMQSQDSQPELMSNYVTQEARRFTPEDTIRAMGGGDEAIATRRRVLERCGIPA